MFQTEVLRGHSRGMSVPTCLFSQDLEGLAEVFGGMFIRTSGRKLPLWAEKFVSDRVHVWPSMASVALVLCKTDFT